MSKNATLRTSQPFSKAVEQKPRADIINFPTIDRLPSSTQLKQAERVELRIALDGRPHGASSTLYPKGGMPLITDCNPVKLLEALQAQHENPDSVVVKIKSGNGFALFEGTLQESLDVCSIYAEEQAYKPITPAFAPATCEQS